MLVVLGYSRLLWCRFYPRQDMATLIDGIEEAFLYFGHLVMIRGNSYRMRQHTELCQTLHAPQDPEPAPARRRCAHQEAATI